MPQSLSERANAENPSATMLAIVQTRGKKITGKGEKQRINQTKAPLPPLLQTQRVLSRLPIPTNPLSTRRVLLLHILLVVLPLVGISYGVNDFLRSLAGGAADLSGNVADRGFESFVEDLAKGVADDAQGSLCVRLC